jgi:hypothetical protein
MATVPLFLSVIPAGAPPVKDFATGIYVWDTTGTSPVSASNPMMTNADVDGFRLKIRWRDIQTAAATFDWSRIDDSITNCNANGKKLLLSVSAGVNAPDWIFTNHGGTCTPFNCQTPGGNGTMPLSFEAAYQTLWDAFIALLATKYDGNTTITGMYNTGKGEQSLEFFVCPGNATDIANYETAALAAGFTDTGFGAKSNALRSGANHVMATWNTAFIKTPIYFTTAKPWGTGTNNAASNADLNTLLSTWKSYGNMRGDCSEQFHATPAPHADTGLVLGYAHAQECVDFFDNSLGLGIYRQPWPNPFPDIDTVLTDATEAAYDEGCQNLTIFQPSMTGLNQTILHTQRLKLIDNLS